MAKFSKVQFKPSIDLSAIHAAYVVATGAPCTDERTESLLVGTATELNTRLLSSSIDIPLFWHQLYAAYAGNQSLQSACESALLKGGGSELQLEQTGKAVARLVGDCVSKFKKRFPKLDAQLLLRANPLKTNWDTYGPGLLIEIASSIWASAPPNDWWPASTHGWLLQPMRGGDGHYDDQVNRFWIEAMLTDKDPGVPEVLRVGWLVTQLAVGKHARSTPAQAAEKMPMEKLPWAMGTLPIVLSAGAELGVIQGPLPIEKAVRMWRMGDAGVADVLADWWQQWRETKAAIPVALKALSKMLESVRATPQHSHEIDLGDLGDLEDEF